MEEYGIKGFSKLDLGGTIKTIPQDFIVEELTPDKKVCTIRYGLMEKIKDFIPKSKKSKEEHIHFTLIKKNWTTLRAISKISQRLKISKGRFGYGGIKDRRAVTAQRVSVWNVKLNDLKKVRIKDIIIKNFEYSNERLTLGDLYGNRFTITIKGTDAKKAGMINDVLKNGVPNYFGPQRFGSQRPVNHFIGKQLLLGNFEGAVMILLTSTGNEDEKCTNARKFAAENWGNWKEIIKIWPRNLGIEAAVLNYLVKYPKDYANALRELPKNLRRMFIHAFQSYIFNTVVSEMENPPEMVPLIGYDTKLEGQVGEIANRILNEEGIKQEDFRLKRMPKLAEAGLERKSKIYVEDLKILKANRDIIKLSFTLEKGCYATTILGYLGVEC